MRSTQLHAPTLKEVPRDAEVASHQLLVRGGYIRRVAAGVYNFLPLGHRVLMKVAQIVREEMNRSGAQEVLMPLIQPAELWQESDRWAQYGPEMMHHLRTILCPPVRLLPQLRRLYQWHKHFLST